MQVVLLFAICLQAGDLSHSTPEPRVIGKPLESPVSTAITAASATPEIQRVEVLETSGGQLLTLFQLSRSGREYPVLSVFKDTMADADPSNDRLRYVWVLNHKNPSPARRALAAIPFFYIRTPSKPAAIGTVPRPILDLAKPARSTVSSLARTFSQIQFLDPLGTAVRSATRSYRNNDAEYRAIRIAQAASALEHTSISGIPRADLQAIRSRLLLSTATLGGLVSDKALSMVHEKELTRREEMRGQNWELIRREAEDNGLYFQPLRLAGGPESHGLVWVSRDDLSRYVYKPYNGRFLKVSNPWKDRGLRGWKGYSETRVIAGKETELIPLALYGFDHPKVPHLLIAMRTPYGPRYREVLRRAANDSMVGVLGVSRFASWHVMAGLSTWTFITGRRGAANNRAWRTRSYAEFKHRLALDESLDPGLRRELQRQLNRLAVNPLDEATDVERRTAENQYRALAAWAKSPGGLARKIRRDRSEELALARTNPTRRTLAQAAHWLSLGIYRPQAAWNAAAAAELDQHRRQAYASVQRAKHPGATAAADSAGDTGGLNY